MNEKSFAVNVVNPSIFWRTIYPWLRWAIVLTGLGIGVSSWFAALTSVGPLVLLFFIASSGTAALIVKIVFVVVFLLSVFISLVVIPWLVFMAIFWICNSVVTLSESESFAEFIFKN